ncbi:response regulator [Allomuricauda sp. SCSIO 65647]|uniref:response regulator n=1 Tax=Allomuricauda sp. SCSIO 65647 TaxID=2908843 RepID=UPI001F2E6092|nr:response regulator [Muricauda sp. SCSIO 65647]UJH66690.1 response regulator [Muricauda sp. SCSIO 65647]
MGKLKSILLIDDDEVTNYVNSILFKKADCCEKLEICQDGQAALNFLNNCIAQRTHFPEIILLDINMPKMSGWEFIDEYIKIEKAYRQNTAVVMLTTSLNVKDEVFLQHYEEVRAFCHKPLSVGQINGLVRAYS